MPKLFIPNFKEFYEKRWFCSGLGVVDTSINLLDEMIPFGTDLLFEAEEYYKFGIEICEDLWNVNPPSSNQAIAGALISVNLSASNELVAKAEYRRSLVSSQSARCVSGYIYASAGISESTTDVVYSGHAIIAENGVLLNENSRFNSDNQILYAEIDCQRLFMTRIIETSINDNPMLRYRSIRLNKAKRLEKIRRTINPSPFIPQAGIERTERCNDVFNIQVAGLKKRLRHTGLTCLVIGVSGGLDSTLALLVACEACKQLGFHNDHITTVTMPGFGTTDVTYGQAKKLCQLLKTKFLDLDIRDACNAHFKDIGHDPQVHDIVYENVQARERTQILMNIANKKSGLVVGTGDLSEIALGWSTFNGDHMSMYAVNCGVPKTLIQFVIGWIAENSKPNLKKLLNNVLKTPITPELLPISNTKEIIQKTEELIGPYELHDFFLYHLIKYGSSVEKIKFLAKNAFVDKYKDEEIEKWLALFIKRFFSQQFKRNCIPDGPKVGTISLSPRGDWRMPSDATDTVWQN